MINTDELYNIQLKKIINRFPLKQINIFFEKYDTYGKTRLEKDLKHELTLPYYYYNINENIYKDILKICKKYRIYLTISISPYGDKIYSVNNIPIIIIANINYKLESNIEHYLDLYLRYSLPIYYNSKLIQLDLKNYINIDNINIQKPNLSILEFINNNINKQLNNKYIKILNKENYIITGIEAYNKLLKTDINEEYKTIILFNSDIEFIKLINKNYRIDKKLCNLYIFKYYFDIYDNDKLIFRIFDMRKTVMNINIINKINITNSHGTITFLLINYLIDNNILFLYLAHNLIYELHNNNNLITTCFTNDVMINNIKYVITSKQ